MKIVFITLVLALSGCRIESDTDTEWYVALKNHVCTPEQFARALSESKQLMEVDNSGKYFEYWMGRSVIRICEKRKELK